MEKLGLDSLMHHQPVMEQPLVSFIINKFNVHQKMRVSIIFSFFWAEFVSIIGIHRNSFLNRLGSH